MAKRLNEVDIKAMVSAEIHQALAYDRAELSSRRSRAIEYRDGIMRDTPSAPNRSKMVSRDVGDAIDKTLPAIIRTFTASGRICEYEPQGPEDEAGAKQAGDLMQHAFFKENNGYKVLYNSAYDALLTGNGVVKTYWDDAYDDYKEETYTGIDEPTVALLMQDPDIEIVEQNNVGETAGPDGQPVALYDVKVRKIRSKGKLCFEAFPPEDLLKNEDCIDLEDARFVAQRRDVTRSELVEMGFDRKIVDILGPDSTDLESEEKLSRTEYLYGLDEPHDDSMKRVTLYECYLKADIDKDGIAETIQAYYAGQGGAGELLSWEELEGDHPFCDIPCEPVPHQYEAQSLADKFLDIAQIKTVMLRAAIDNQYAHNNPQPIVVEGSVINKDSITSPKFGQPILVRKGMEKPVEWRDTPYIGDKIFMMMEYLDKIGVERSGMSGQASALDPETLQNQSATAAQLQHDVAYSRSELIARNMAEGFRKVFRKALKLLVANQDRVKTIRLRNEWVPMDPRSWNADMDCTINVGLGTGSRDRDLAMLNVIGQSQYMLAQAAVQNGQPQVALEMLPKIVATLVKQGEAAGIRNADDYYPDFNEQKLQQMAQIGSQPKEDPKIALEKQKLQMDMQGKQADMQIRMREMDNETQMRQAEMAMEREKLTFEQAKMVQDYQLKSQLEREKMAAKVEQERAQMEADLVVKQQEMQLEAQLEREKMQMQMEMQTRQMAAQSAPKSSRVIRNKDGKVESVETVTQ